ncbi:hypothetical protein B296_00052877, partial [Ensete ventricosum]
HNVWSSSGSEEATTNRGVVLDGSDVDIEASSVGSEESDAAFDHPHLRCMTRMKLDNKGVAIGKQGKGRSAEDVALGRGEGGREGVAPAVAAGVIKKRLLLDEVNDCKPDNRGCGLVTMPRKQEDGSKRWVSVGGGVPSSRRNRKQHEQMVAAAEGEAEEATTSAFGATEAMIEDKSMANNERKASVVLQRSCPWEGLLPTASPATNRRGGRPLAGWLPVGKGSRHLRRGSDDGAEGERGVRASFGEKDDPTL